MLWQLVVRRCGVTSAGEEHVIVELRQVIAPRLANQPAPERVQYLLSPILFPIEQLPADPQPE